MIKVGAFFKVYGKDAYIISNIFQYKIKEEKGIVTCGFPVESQKKIQSTLENKKISYIILDSKNSYSEIEKMDFGNLNTYMQCYENSKVYVNNYKRIEKIYKYLIENAKKEELRKIIRQIEDIIELECEI